MVVAFSMGKVTVLSMTRYKKKTFGKRNATRGKV